MPAKKQPELNGMTGPGVERPEIPELDEAIDKFVKARDHAKLMKERSDAAETNVKKLMHEHKDTIGVDANGEIVYRSDDEVVVLKPGQEKLQVKKAPEVT